MSYSLLHKTCKPDTLLWYWYRWWCKAGFQVEFQPKQCFICQCHITGPPSSHNIPMATKVPHTLSSTTLCGSTRLDHSSSISLYDCWYHKQSVMGQRVFSFNGPHAWNAPPPPLQNLKLLVAFHKQLKTHFFNCVYYRYCDVLVNIFWTSTI